MAREFKLGPPLLKTSDSTALLPDTWRTDLLHKHLDKDGRAALAHTCKAGLNLLLDEWEDATLSITVRPSSDESPTALLRRMRAANKQLKRRSRGSTSLWFQQGNWETPQEDTWGQVALSGLMGFCDTVTKCRLHLQHIPQQLLSLAGETLPTLRTLELGSPGDKGYSAQLPPPSHLPSLRELTLGRAAEGTHASLWASVAPYLPQLTSLTIAEQPAGAPPALIFSRTHPTTTLTEFSVYGYLTPALAGLLQTAAPALGTLTVWGVSAWAAGAPEVAPACTWRELRVTRDGILPPCVWEWLPVSNHGLVLDYTKCDAVVSELHINLPLSTKVAQTLQSVSQKGAEWRMLSHELPPTDQPRALREALPAIQSLHTANVDLTLHGFTMSHDLANEMRAIAAVWGTQLCTDALIWRADVTMPVNSLPYFKYLDLAQPLTNALLNTLIACKAQAMQLYVPDLKLTSPAPEGAAGLWDRVCLSKSPCLSDWLEQAQLFGAGTTGWLTGGLRLSLSVQEIARGRHKSFIEQLRRIRKPQCISLHIQPSPGTLNKEHGLVVRESLAVAKALSNPPLTVTLRNFNTFGDVVEQLRELPHGETLLLDLKSLFGPAEDAAEGTWPVGQAAALIPASFTTWYVSSKMLRPAELGAFLSNLPKDRTKARPLTVKVTGKSAQWAEQWNASLRQAGTDAFVTVVGEP